MFGVAGRDLGTEGSRGSVLLGTGGVLGSLYLGGGGGWGRGGGGGGSSSSCRG